MRSGKILLVGDIHLADRPPSIRTETYTEDILAKLKQAVSIAREHGCIAIVLAGDVFHIKTPTRNSHALVIRTGEVLTEADIPVYIVPGNHDLSNDRLDSLRKQPLGVLTRMEGIELLLGPAPDDLPLYGLPYLADWMNDLPKWMAQYRAWSDQNKAESMDFWPLMVTHAPIFPAGETPPYDYISADDWAGMMQNGDFYWGHIHDPNGAFRASADLPVWGCNQGAISRGSLHEKTLKREPAVTIWDNETPSTDGNRFTRIPLEFRPAESVFRLHEKEEADERSTRVEEFLTEVGQTRLNGLSLEEVQHHARERGLNPRTLSLIEDLLEHA